MAASSAVTSASATTLPSSTAFDSLISTSARTPPPLTTPYSFPRECDAPPWNITIAASLVSADRDIGGYHPEIGAKLSDTFLYIPSGDKYHPNERTYFSNCYQPTEKTLGRVAEAAQYTYHHNSKVYRNAVCPKDWVAFNVGLASGGEGYKPSTESMSTWSTAVCCKSGHEVVTDIFRLYYQRDLMTGESAWACAQTMLGEDKILGAGPFMTAMPYTTRYKVNETIGSYSYYEYDTVETTSIIYWRGGRAYYPGWSIEWMAEDNVTLNPPWPTLTSDMVVPTWVPGENIKNYGQYDNKGSGRTRPTASPKSKFDRVGVPLIATLAGLLGLLLLGGLIFWCLRKRRVKRLVKEPSEEAGLETRD